MIRILILLVVATSAHAEIGLSLGHSKYGVSSAVGLYSETLGLEIGAAGSSDRTTQHPGGSKQEEPPRGLDGIVYFGDGQWKLYGGLGAYFWTETTLTPGAGAIVLEERQDHVRGAVSLGVRHFGPTRVHGRGFDPRNLTYGIGWHSIRGPNLSVGYQW